jgi:hypothetical protein
VRISISGISAKCPSCASDSFIADASCSPGRQDLFNCAKCGAEVHYGELIQRISDESMRRAKAKTAPEPSSPSRA